MKLRYAIIQAVHGLKSNRSRSALTILGIVIGITAIMMVMAIGAGAQELILSQIQGWGSRTISIEPGREPQGPSDFAEMYTDSLTEKDIRALSKLANVQDLKDMTPVVTVAASVNYKNESVRTTVWGSSDLLTDILDIRPAEGAMFTDEDVRQRASVAVLGAEIKNKLFNGQNAIGEKIKVKNQSLRVIGVMGKKGRVSLVNVDDIIFIPYTTAQEYLLGINYYHSIIAQAVTDESVERVARDVELTLRETHGIADPSKDDFHVTTQADAIERVGVITGVLTLLLGAVAAISLVVGGIGIMNIMLVAVAERTREIGLRKAVGARDRDILIPFLCEAVMLTGIGGIVGIAFGAFLSWSASVLLSRFATMQWAFVFPIDAALLGLGVSALIGLVFGLYPAKKAAGKSPIEALRYE